MRRTDEFLTGGAIAVAVIGGGVGIAVATGVVDDDDETEVPITGDALDRASEVVLEHVGEGRVTDTEVGDEEGYYGVEVTLDNGDEIDVHLDEDFNFLGTESDADESEDDD